MTHFSLSKILGPLFLLLTVSCISTKNCVIYKERDRNDFLYRGFDTTYTSARSLKDKWVLEYINKANLKGLSDSLIVLVYTRILGRPTPIFNPPILYIKSDSTYICTYCEDNIRTIKRSNTNFFSTNEDEKAFFPAVFNWDIPKLKHLLDCGVADSFGSYRLIKLVRNENKILAWTEYIFSDLVFWEYCDTLSVRKHGDPYPEL